MDPWYLGAQQRHEDQRRQASEAEARQREAEARRNAEEAAAEAARTEMEQAIAEAVPLLTRFLQERGAAAQALLAASSDRACVVFGGDDEGGESDGVFLCKDGLMYELAIRSGYGSTPVKTRPATPKEAVETFAYSGPGYKNPQKVRNIVTWLTERINEYLPR